MISFFFVEHHDIYLVASTCGDKASFVMPRLFPVLTFPLSLFATSGINVNKEGARHWLEAALTI